MEALSCRYQEGKAGHTAWRILCPKAGGQISMAKGNGASGGRYNLRFGARLPQQALAGGGIPGAKFRNRGS